MGKTEETEWIEMIRRIEERMWGRPRGGIDAPTSVEANWGGTVDLRTLIVAGSALFCKCSFGGFQK